MCDRVQLRGDGPIVMTDDSESDAFLARTCHAKSSVENEFRWIDSGGALLEYFDGVREGTEPMPALVLLDINMPGLDGFEVLRVVRATPEFRNIPIISMFTNSDDVKDIETSKSLGANAFFTKPADIRDYVEFFDSLARA
jgi:CheY-like chemotaxis protein